MAVSPFGQVEDPRRHSPSILPASRPCVAKDRNAGFRDGGGSMVLGREDVARGPADFRAERRQRFDQHGGLDRHVQGAGDAGALERLAVLVFSTQSHQARHFDLRHVQLGAAPFGEREVLDEVRFVRSEFGHDRRHVSHILDQM